MTTLVSYHNSVAEKRATLAQLREHRRLDQIVQGTYWDATEHRGCAVGCLTHEPDGGHGLFPERWGIPAQLAYLVDEIFEALPVEMAREWPVRFMSAVPVGADLSGVWDRFALWMLNDLVKAGQDPDGVVSRMAGLFGRQVSGDLPSDREWSDAARAAWSAQSAESADVLVRLVKAAPRVKEEVE